MADKGRTKRRKREFRGGLIAVIAGAAALGVAVQSVRGSAFHALSVLGICIAVLLLVRHVAGIGAEVRQLAQSEARFRALVQHSSDATLIVDESGRIAYGSPATQEIFGEAAQALVGRSLESLVHADDLTHLRRFLDELVKNRDGSIVQEWRINRGDGLVWTENTGTNLLDEPTVQGMVLVARDVSQRRTLEASLTKQAFHDELTRLANRALFLNRVAHAVARAPRGRHPAAVLFLDLDDFKKVNDSLGHAAGDELLVAAAGRLTTCIRPGDTIARLGGDEFAILLEDVDQMGDVTAVAERVSNAMRTPFHVSGRDVFIGVSIGIASVALGDTADDVLRNADLAMYFAKGQQKGHFAIYAREMHAQVMERLELEADLRTAVERRAFHVEYQPIVHLMTGEVYGAEALLRWQHPSHGLISPSKFVAIAEETGLIVPIGCTVLREACHNAREWQGRRRHGRPLRISVNLSARHFQEASLIDDVQSALTESGLDPWQLTLEITESVLMQRSELSLDKLRELKALGLNLAIDDFGTGYSSLGYLQQFPIDILKIDRTFVDAVGNRDADPVLARAIIALGRTLGVETVAEGVERPAQRDGLRVLGCTLGQGYLFARPMSGDEFTATMLDPPRSPSVVEMYGRGV